MQNNHPFWNTIAVGQEFQAFQLPEDNGLFHRLSGVNRLYYTREFALAHEVLTALVSEGVEALRVKAPEGSELYDVWDDMSRTGFFFNLTPVPPFAVALAANADAQMPLEEQLQTYGPAIEAFNPKSPHFHLYVREAGDITAAGLVIADAYPLRPLWGPEDRTGTTISIFSPLLGDDESCVPALIQFMEETDSKLVYETTIESASAENTVLQRLEEDGFLAVYRVTLGTDLVLDPRRRESASETIARWLCEEPNREIILNDQPFSGNESTERINQYFDGVEDLLERLLKIDEDISRLSPVQRALNCILQSRNLDNVLEGWILDGALHFHHGWDGDCIAAMAAPSAEDVTGFFQQLLERLRNGQQIGNHSDSFPYQRFYPMSLSALFMEGNRNETLRLIHERRRRIWNKLFDRLLAEFIQISRENAELGTPLKLDISEDRQAVYSPLYPRSKNHDSTPVATSSQ